MDYNLFKYINNFVGQWICLDSLAIFCAEYLVYFLVAGVILFFFFIKKQERVRYLILIVSSAILSRLIITEFIRLFWHRSRPFMDYPVNQLIEHSASGSFPSGHIAFLFPLAAVIYFFNKKFGIAFFILSLFVGLGRVFVGIHYPFDILGGAVIGVFSAIIIWVLINKKLKILNNF